MRPDRKFLTGGALVALAIVFVASLLISNALFRGVQLDLTQNRLYTLSQGTKNILAGVGDPIHLHLFFSDKGTGDLPQFRTHAQRVRDLLEEMVARSDGKLTLEVVDPLPFSEDEDRATGYGLQAVPGGAGGENIYLGLVGTNSTDGKAVIPLLQPDKEIFLEYNIAKLVHELSVPKKAAVGMISGLPMAPGFDSTVHSMVEPWAIEQQLRQLFDVRELNAGSLTTVDPDIKVVVLVHPKGLSDDAQYAIDQFVMRGGRLLVFVDPNAETDPAGANPDDPRAAMLADRSSDLPRLFKGWGIEYDPHQVVLDRAHAVTVNVKQGARPARVASILGLGKRDFNSDDVTTAYLERINMSTAGFFRLAKDSKYRLVPLIQTGTDAMVVPVERVRNQTDPAQLLQDYKAGNESQVIAARLEGRFTSAFPERTAAGHLPETKGEGEIILVADTDVLTNRLWVQLQPVNGQTVLNTFANNGDLFINALDYLAGSTDLTSIRGRAVSQRPFTRVEDMERGAEESFRGKDRELRQQLSATERKLAAMQRVKGNQNEQLLTHEQQQEIDTFVQKKVEIRKALRQVRRGLDEQINDLGARLKLINIGLIPLLITLGALAYAWWKRRHRAH